MLLGHSDGALVWHTTMLQAEANARPNCTYALHTTQGSAGSRVQGLNPTLGSAGRGKPEGCEAAHRVAGVMHDRLGVSRHCLDM